MENKLISIVMCNYNYANLVSEAIQSVLDQDYENFELIIIDDGSSDNSREIISVFGLKHPDSIRFLFKDNEGQAEGFNVGINMAKSDIICFLDSDDIWLPGKLSMVNRWFNEKNDIALLQHNMKIMRGKNRTDELFRAALMVGDVCSHTMQTRQLPLFVPTSGLSFSRKVLEKVMPIPKTFKTCADGYLTRTSMCYGKVYADLDIYGYYRLHAENSIFGNENHNVPEYVNDLLTPHLITFYRKNHINIKLKKPRHRFKSWGQLSRIKTIKPHQRVLCSPLYEKVRDRLAYSKILIDSSDRKLEKLMDRYHGKTCHIMGRGCDCTSRTLESLSNDFIFIADTNAINTHLNNLKKGMYCLSDLRFWEQGSQVSPNMKRFLYDIRHLYKMFELPARARSTELPSVDNGTYIFKTVDRDYGIWKGFVTEDCTRRLMWGYHVVLDMCLPLAFHMGFKKIFLHGCLWDRISESERLAKFFAFMGGTNKYNLSENFIPYDTPFGQTELLWKKSYEVVEHHYGKKGVKLECVNYL